MKKLGHIPIDPGRRLGAWACLVAAMLLWAPVWAVACQASGMACCKGMMCLGRGHTGREGAAKPQSVPQKHAPMECNHTSQTGLMTCQMSCCHDQDPPATGAVIFVLPEPMVISSDIEVTPVKIITKTLTLTHFFEPPSPPPRSLSLIA
jgi:hypothetical protein